MGGALLRVLRLQGELGARTNDQQVYAASRWRSQGRPRPLRRGGEGRIRLPALWMQGGEPPRSDGGQVHAAFKRRVQGMPFTGVVTGRRLTYGFRQPIGQTTVLSSRT